VGLLDRIQQTHKFKPHEAVMETVVEGGGLPTRGSTTSDIPVPPCYLPRGPPKVVQELLGHSSISITLDTYSHVPNMQEKAACNG